VLESIWDPINQSPLSTRARVCQERILSRRILYFTDREIFWECLRWRSSETTGPFARSIPQSELEGSLLNVEVSSNLSASDSLQIWACCVNNFTKGELSHLGDKLPAIFGLAKRLQHHLPDTRYLAYLWSINLEKQLLWLLNTDIGHVLMGESQQTGRIIGTNVKMLVEL
jgi:hypothetical protein